MLHAKDRQATLKQGIDRLRKELLSLYQKEGCFQDQKVLAKSKELDQLIVNYTKWVLELKEEERQGQ